MRRIRHRSQRRCTSVAAGRSELWQRLSSDRGTAFNRPRDARSIRRAARAREKNCCSWPDPPPGEGGGSQPTRSLIACSNRTRERPSPGIRARADATLIFAALKCTRSPQAAGMFHLGDFYTRIGLLGWVPTQMHKGQSEHLGFLGSRHQILLPVFVNKEIYGKARAIARIDLKGGAQPRLGSKLEGENFIGALQ